jgi:hypothetical protein
MTDDPNLTPDEAEQLLIRFAGRLPTDTPIDSARLDAIVLNALGAHPDREWIAERVAAGATVIPTFADPDSDEFELRLGQPAYTPNDLLDAEFHARTTLLGTIPLSLILAGPQG